MIINYNKEYHMKLKKKKRYEESKSLSNRSELAENH